MGKEKMLFRQGILLWRNFLRFFERKLLHLLERVAIIGNYKNALVVNTRPRGADTRRGIPKIPQ